MEYAAGSTAKTGVDPCRKMVTARSEQKTGAEVDGGPIKCQETVGQGHADSTTTTLSLGQQPTLAGAAGTSERASGKALSSS